VQAQVLDLLRDLQQDFGTAIILITHDIGVVAQMAEEVLVMYAGQCVERGTVREVLGHPEHPYTWGLLSSVPHLRGDPDIPLVPVRGTPPSLLDVPAALAALRDQLPVDDEPIATIVTGSRLARRRAVCRSGWLSRVSSCGALQAKPGCSCAKAGASMPASSPAVSPAICRCRPVITGVPSCKAKGPNCSDPRAAYMHEVRFHPF